MKFETYLSLDDPFKIPLGWLNSHMLITGINDEYGKTLLRKIAHEIYRNHQNIGMLYLNSLNSRMKYRYPWDEYYYSPRCDPSTPYFHGSTADKINIRKNLNVLCPALGFSNDFKDKFSQYLQGKTLPLFLSQLFAQYESHVLETKEILGEDYLLLAAIQDIIKNSFDNRWKLNSNKLPWIEDLCGGKKVFIDFANNVAYKEWYIMMLLQSIRFRLCNKQERPKKVLVIVENAGYCLNSTFMPYKPNNLLGKF